MRINEIIIGDPTELEEGWKDTLAKGVGGVARGIGSVAGGAHGAWDAMKQGYKTGRAAVSGMGQGMGWEPDGSSIPSGGQNIAPPSANTGTSTTQSGNQAQAPTQKAPEPQTTPDELDNLKATIAKLNPEQKQEIAAQLQQPEIQQPSAPAASGQQDDDDDFEPDYDLPPDFDSGPDTPSPGTAVDIGQVKKQSAQAAQADKQTAQQQIAATQAANADKAKQDAAIKAAKDAAMAKPGFQQTAADKLAIKQAADRGIRESKKAKKKILAEFNSKFLGMVI